MCPTRLGDVRWRCAGGVLLCMILGCLAAPTAGAQSPLLWRIEEDWELVLYQPEPAIHSPQLTLLALPVAGQDDAYFQLELNHAATAEFSGGGYQVAAVRDGATVDFARSDIRETLRTSGDTVRWTNVMAVINGELLYALKDGYGQDWQAFGGPNYLVRMSAGGCQDLSAYSPSSSVAMADIGFGANRVKSLTLRKARFYYMDGTSREVVVNRGL